MALDAQLAPLTNTSATFSLYEVEGFGMRKSPGMRRLTETASKNTLFQARRTSPDPGASAQQRREAR